VLSQLDSLHKPMILVQNKIDLLEGVPEETVPKRSLPQSERYLPSVAVSAATGQGLEKLKGAIRTEILRRREECTLMIPVTSGSLLGQVYARAQVLSQTIDGDQLCLRIQVDSRDLGTLTKAGAVVI